MLVLIILSFSWSVLAEERITVDLDTAISLSFENDLDFQIATINYKKAKLDYEKKKANYLLQQSRYNELEMESSFNFAKNTFQSSKNQLVDGVIREYTNIWLAGLDLEIKNIELQLEKIRLEEAKAQYEIGDIGSIDLLDQENAFNDAEFSLEIARDDYQQNIKEFASKLNLKNKELELTGLNYNQSWQVTEEEAIDTVLENSFELHSKEDQLTLAKIDLERAGVSAAKLDKEIKEKNVEIAELELEKSRDELIKSTKESYYQFKQAVKRIELNKERLTGAEEKYKLRKIQYEAGLITRLEVLEFERNLLQARRNYFSAIADYYLAEINLRQNLGLETEVLLDEITESK